MAIRLVDLPTKARLDALEATQLDLASKLDVDMELRLVDLSTRARLDALEATQLDLASKLDNTQQRVHNQANEVIGDTQ